MNNKICLLCHSGDKNSWVFPFWYNEYKKYDVKISTVFLGETIDPKFPDIPTVLTGATTWSDGLIDYLLTCQYDYVIWIHEDYFLKSYDHVKLMMLLEIVENMDIQLCKICGLWAGFLDEKNPHIPTSIGTGFSGDEFESVLWLYNNQADYLTSQQLSIWNRDFLLSTLHRGETAWEAEIEGTKRLRLRNIPIYTYRGVPPIQYDETVNRGKIRPNCEKYFTPEIIEKYKGA